MRTTIGGAIAAPSSARAMRDPLHKTALVFRIPELHGSRRDRKCTGFADTKKETEHHERRCAGGGGGCGRHCRPIGHNRRENVARAEAIAEPTAGNLKHGVGPSESTEDHTHCDLVETKLLADHGSCGRDVDAVEIGNEVHQADKDQDVPTAHAAARCRLFHIVPLPSRLLEAALLSACQAAALTPALWSCISQSIAASTPPF